MQHVLQQKPWNKAWQLLEDKSRWCTKATYRDTAGNACEVSAGVSCCVIGALALVYPDDKEFLDAVFKVRQVVSKYTLQYLNLVEFNDNYSHDKISFALKEADV